MKEIVYIDLDGVTADFDKDVHLLGERDPNRGECVTPPNYFLNLDLVEGAFEAIHELANHYELFFLSTPQWSNTLSWTEKAEWVKKHFGNKMHKKLILTHDKTLLNGSYLIDDRVQVGYFEPSYEHIHFGSQRFPDWNAVINYLVNVKGF